MEWINNLTSPLTGADCNRNQLVDLLQAVHDLFDIVRQHDWGGNGVAPPLGDSTGL